VNLTLKVWRQSGPTDSGHFETYEAYAGSNSFQMDIEIDDSSYGFLKRLPNLGATEESSLLEPLIPKIRPRESSGIPIPLRSPRMDRTSLPPPRSLQRRRGETSFYSSLRRSTTELDPSNPFYIPPEPESTRIGRNNSYLNATREERSMRIHGPVDTNNQSRNRPRFSIPLRTEISHHTIMDEDTDSGSDDEMFVGDDRANELIEGAFNEELEIKKIQGSIDRITKNLNEIIKDISTDRRLPPPVPPRNRSNVIVTPRSNLVPESAQRRLPEIPKKDDQGSSLLGDEQRTRLLSRSTERRRFFNGRRYSPGGSTLFSLSGETHTCPSCPSIFGSETSLNDHFVAAHMVTENNHEDGYVCDVCGQEFDDGDDRIK